MSFIHHTFVGHFDPATVACDNLAFERPIDPTRVASLLAEYPAGVAELVTLEDGYAKCQWAPAGGLADKVFEFAYLLARMERCLAVENGRQIFYPPEAARLQGEALERLTGRDGLAEDMEQQARNQAADFESRRA